MGKPFVSATVIIMLIKSPLDLDKYVEMYKIMGPRLVAEIFVRGYGITRKERLTPELEWESG